VLYTLMPIFKFPARRERLPHGRRELGGRVYKRIYRLKKRNGSRVLSMIVLCPYPDPLARSRRTSGSEESWTIFQGGIAKLRCTSGCHLHPLPHDELR
jgi:hypothetical protein